jgi:hypothetical protein
MSLRRPFGCALVFPLSMGLAASAAAQQQPADKQPVALVLKGGMSTDDIQAATESGATSEVGKGFVGGISFTGPTTTRLGFQAEFLINEQRRPALAPAFPSQKVAVLMVPLFLRATLSDTGRTKAHLLVGPEFAVRLARGEDTADERIVQERDDYAVAIGLDLEIGPQVLIDLRYSRGLVAFEPGVTAGQFNKRRGIAVMFGWRLY